MSGVKRVKLKPLLLMFAVLSLFVLTACGSADTPDTNNGDAPVGEQNTEQGAEEANQGFEHITGIDAGAGVMQATEKAIEEYGLDIELIPSSSSAMTAALGAAIENNEWIVV